MRLPRATYLPAESALRAAASGPMPRRVSVWRRKYFFGPHRVGERLAALAQRLGAEDGEELVSDVGGTGATGIAVGDEGVRRGGARGIERHHLDMAANSQAVTLDVSGSPSSRSSDSLCGFVERTVAPPTLIVTDNGSGYAGSSRLSADTVILEWQTFLAMTPWCSPPSSQGSSAFITA